jgi:hypothetical protein
LDEEPAGSNTLVGYSLLVPVFWTTSKGEEMTLKSRLAGLVTILMLFALAPSMFAQVQITIIPDVDPGDINTNNNAIAAAPGTNGSGVLVVGQLIAASNLSATVLRIAYPGPITSLPSGATNCTIGGFTTLNVGNANGGAFSCGVPNGVPSADPIRIVGQSGVFGGMNAQPLLNTTNQRIEIQLPGTGGATNSSSGSFRLVGVRINANGLTGAQTVTASLNTTVNNYLLGSPSTGTVINTLNPGIASLAIGLAPGNSTIANNSSNPPAGAATIFTNRNVARSIGAFILTEGCASCWRTKTQNGNNGASVVDNSTQIRLTFNNVPAGVTLNILAPSIGTASTNASLGASIGNTSITSAANTAVIDFTSTSLTNVETLEVDYTVTVATTAAVTTGGTVTVTATMAPAASTPFDTTTTSNGPGGITLTGLPTEANGYPTFTDLEVGPLTVVNIVAANTTMLMPYALTLTPFDTGLAVANTTADPFGTGSGGATPASGTLVLNFFPTTATGAGTSFSLTTSSTVRPGTGLSSDGTLAAGATWTVLLSQLLSAAGQTGSFQGYVFIQANFLNAHGTATISDFKTYSLTANVLVLPPPATSPRSGGAFSVESLNQ